MADKKNEVAEKKQWSTAVSNWTNTLTDLVTRDFETCGVQFDEYSKQCAMSAMTTIYQLVKSNDKFQMENIDTSNLREIVGQCASLKLNANAVPRECYFQLRTKKIGSDYVQMVEFGIEGDGNDALLRNHGVNVDSVYPCWLVHEGDDFTYPKHKGIELTPPEWEEKGLSQKVIRVVYPIKLKNGAIQYEISERESVKGNLFAHVKNNLMNETFGICENRYKATPKQLDEIKDKKYAIYEAMRKCETIDDMVLCKEAQPYMSPAWIDTPEAMIVRKMRNNATKKYPKNFDPMAKQSLMQMDETYQVVQEEIAENANSEGFIVDVEESDTDVVDAAEPEFMK